MKFKRFLFLLLLVIGGLTLVGCAGKDGIDGVAGEKGPTGDTGPEGDRGPQGIQGIPGENGEDGEDGKDGAQGPQGPQGIQGETGPQGIPGVDGDTLEFRIHKGVLQQKYTKEDESAWRDVFSLDIISKWSQKYTVTLDVNGGQLPADAKAEYTELTFTTELELPVPTKEHYEFKGWELDGKVYEKLTVEDNVILTAAWEAVAYKVEFVPGEGQGLPETLSTLEEFANEIVEDFKAAGTAVTTRNEFADTSHPNIKNVFAKPEMLTKYTWFFQFIKAELEAMGEANPEIKTEDFEGPIPYVELNKMLDGMIAGDTNAASASSDGNDRTAFRQFVWKIINIDNAEATSTKGAYNYLIPEYTTADIARFEAVLQKATGTYYTVEDELPTLTLENFWFEGWFDGEGEDAKQVTKVTSDCKLYAKYTRLEEKLFDVTFDLAEGAWAEGFTAPTQLTPASELPTPERSGYVFTGWVDAEGNPVEKISGPAALTATWEEAKVDVAVGEAKNATLFVAPIAANLAEGATIKSTNDKVLTVGTDLFGTLEAALAKAEAGAVIYLAAGEYALESKLTDDVTILGPNADLKVAAFAKEEAVITVKKDVAGNLAGDIEFNGLHIKGVGGGAGVSGVSFQNGGLTSLVVKSCVLSDTNTMFKLQSDGEFKATFVDCHVYNIGQFFFWVTAGMTSVEVTGCLVDASSCGPVTNTAAALFRVRAGSLVAMNNVFNGDQKNDPGYFECSAGASKIEYNTFNNVTKFYHTGATNNATFNNNLYLDAEGNALATSPNGDAKIYDSAKALAEAYAKKDEVVEVPTIEDVRNLYVDANVADVTVQGVVTGVVGNSYFVQDGDFAIYVYNHSNHGYVVGDKVSVTGTLTVYNGLYEITTVTASEKIEGEFAAEALELTNANYNATALAGKDSVLVKFEGLIYESGKVTVGSNSSINFKTAEGTAVLLYVGRYTDTAAATAMAEVVNSLAAGDTVDLKNCVLGWYNVPQLTPFAADSVVLVEKAPVIEEPDQPGEETGKLAIDFVTEFADYASSWSTSYTSHTVSNTDLGLSTGFTVVFSNANKQTAGNSIDDRPVACAKSGTQYVTLTLTDAKATAVEFDLKQWTTKTFSSIVIEYYNGTEWVAACNPITVPAKLSATLDQAASQVRLTYTTSSSSNTQLGVSGINVTLE